MQQALQQNINHLHAQHDAELVNKKQKYPSQVFLFYILQSCILTYHCRK